MEIAGIVGKPNVGKSTLFSALSLVNVEIANYPFTTTKTNVGVTYVRIECVCKKLGVKDNPRNSICVDGVRLVPIQIIDCPGIIREAHKGKGLGLKFLDEIRQASLLIVVADASGGTLADGTPAEPFSHDPVEDVEMVLDEFDAWLAEIIGRDWPRISRAAEAKQLSLTEELAKKLSGLGVAENHVTEAVLNTGLDRSKPTTWTSENLLKLATEIRRMTKPVMVAANKADIDGSEKNVEKLRRANYEVVPVSAEAERTLRLAAAKGLVNYIPGDPDFTIPDESKLTAPQKKALAYIREKVFAKWGGTGVQQLINKAYLEKLGYIPVYPVENPHSFSDHDGNVLPDVYLMPRNSTARDLAYKIHSELGEGFLYAVNALTGMRLADNQPLKPNDVISIVSAKKRG
ncbi:MAG: redox-regulated ATPase YchF [Candidatus Caldarchaeum sp.]|nr:redox-regulated ATPase YchF [Candidatus Caldarchaeum sp.]MDW8435046.1 redox-regulated ATPase YchF [Candidatus Caldarchaeum sp.]